MEGSGLTPFALGFLILSMGSVTALAGYCYWRILTEPDAGKGVGAGPPAPEERAGGPDPERG